MILMHVTEHKVKDVTYKQVLAEVPLWQCWYPLLSAKEVRILC